MIPAAHHPHPPARLTGVPTADERIGVLFVGSDAAVRNSVRRLTDGEPDLAVEVVADGGQALAQAAARPVDVVVVDHDLGDGHGGLALACALGALDRPPRVLVYSACPDTALAVGAIIAGASGLLGKTALGDELCDAIRTVASGGLLFPPIPRDLIDSVIPRLHLAEQWVVESLEGPAGVVAGPSGRALPGLEPAVRYARAAARELRR